jgi:CO/xanthine dehydrogenase FAD-binding subunit
MLYQPQILEEALTLKADLGGDVDALAGGTDLLVALNRGQWRAKNVLDLSRVVGRSEIRKADSRFSLAHGVTHSQLTRLPVRALAEAALSIGGPQIRNRGTWLCWPCTPRSS